MSTPSEAADELHAVIQDLNRAITHCIEIGFVTPLYAAVVSVNGSVLVVQYTPLASGGMECDVLAERTTPDKMMMLPINIMISDSRGDAARVFIGADRKPAFFH